MYLVISSFSYAVLKERSVTPICDNFFIKSIFSSGLSGIRDFSNRYFCISINLSTVQVWKKIYTIDVPRALPNSFNSPNPASCNFFIASTAPDLCPLFLNTLALSSALKSSLFPGCKIVYPLMSALSKSG